MHHLSIQVLAALLAVESELQKLSSLLKRNDGLKSKRKLKEVQRLVAHALAQEQNVTWSAIIEQHRPHQAQDTSPDTQ
jgi:hypothetical protein